MKSWWRWTAVLTVIGRTSDHGTANVTLSKLVERETVAELAVCTSSRVGRANTDGDKSR